MTFDLQTVLERKRKLRRELAARPVAEKLRMLDALRRRVITIRTASRPKAPAQPGRTTATSRDRR